MKKLILITNDDGIRSPGLKAAAEAADAYGDLLIAAPIGQQTGMGRAFPRTEDQGIIEKIPLNINGREQIGYGVHGSPSYAVAHGVLELADRKPDLCISGINYGENMGMVLTCSGTVGAAIEAVSHGIPGIAVSLEADLSFQRMNEYPDISWDKSKEVLDMWIGKVIREGMPEKTDILNINIPLALEDSRLFRVTVQSRQNYFCFIKPQSRDFSQSFKLNSERKVDMMSLEKNSDIYATYVEHVTSVTPITCDMSAEHEYPL
ncbi:MAG: 5'/3'-nucleotidase SurE [Hespellia sp.]|nr:5'/3'-nucleotidase SurE [Hespellia sp.]